MAFCFSLFDAMDVLLAPPGQCSTHPHHHPLVHPNGAAVAALAPASCAWSHPRPPWGVDLGALTTRSPRQRPLVALLTWLHLAPLTVLHRRHDQGPQHQHGLGQRQVQSGCVGGVHGHPRAPIPGATDGLHAPVRDFSTARSPTPTPTPALLVSIHFYDEMGGRASIWCA